MGRKWVKAKLNLGLGMGIGMNHWEWEGMGWKKSFPLISTLYPIPAKLHPSSRTDRVYRVVL